MISEKTVELNLTTELVNMVFALSGTRPYILAPSQRQESSLAFDVALGQPGGQGVLIQYKRAYVNRPNEYTFHLNRTKNQDQHLRLTVLDLLGIPVYYAFPIFHTPNEVINHRRALLLRTKFVKPTRISPVGGLTGHHEVIFNNATNSWAVHSDEGTPIDGIQNFNDIYDELFNPKNESNIKNILETFNSVFSNKEGTIIKDYKIEVADEDDYFLMQSQSILTI